METALYSALWFLAILSVWALIQITNALVSYLSEAEDLAQARYDYYRAKEDMLTRPRCEAKQFSDMMVCRKCNLRWDTNDSNPPECPELS